METTHTIITILSVLVLLLSIYIYLRKEGKAENFVSPLYNDLGSGHEWDNQDYATVSGL
jgi:hypothetical protein